MGFLINSEIHKWIQRDPKLVAGQAKLLQSQHSPSWMKWDSYVDCNEIFEFTDAELKLHQDRVSDGGIKEIKRAVSQSIKLEREFKDLILK